MQIIDSLLYIRLSFSRVSLVPFIMIRLGSLERDYSLFRGVITLEKPVQDRSTADMAAQFTWIATTSKRTPNNPDNFC